MRQEQTDIVAVNHMLRVIGDAAINSLANPNKDAQIALNTLSGVATDVLSFGWWFNHDESLLLIPDTDGIIHIPANTLVIDPVDPSIKFASRSGKLYDVQKQTFIHEESVYVELISFVELEDMPYVAFSAILHKAAYDFASDLEADEVQLERLYARARAAWQELRSRDIRNRDTNMFNSPKTARVLAGFSGRRY